MEKINNYTLIAGYGMDVLEREVKKAICEGWQPIGGVSSPEKLYYYQAMVKYSQEEEKKAEITRKVSNIKIGCC